MEKPPKFVEWPIWDDQERQALIDVINSGEWWAGAPKSQAGSHHWRFQTEFAEFNGSKYAFGCTNGTHAIEVSLLALGIGLGDEVIVPEWTFVATASSVIAANAVPMFCDVDPETFLIDPQKIEALITPKTKAIIVVHLAGMPCDMDAILAIATKHSLRVVEDCAHAHGSSYKGRKVGNWGDVGTFSFQASKVVNAGEGGAIVCNNEELSQRIYEVLDCGRHPGEWFYNHYTFGSNYRLSEFNAAILRTQLKKYPAQLALRNKNALYLNGELKKIPGVHPQLRKEYVDTCAHYVYIIYLDPAHFHGIAYPEIYKNLREKGIPVDDCYPPLHTIECFTAMRGKPGIDYSGANWGGVKSAPGHFPVVEKIHAHAFQLEQKVLLSGRDALDYVVAEIASLK